MNQILVLREKRAKAWETAKRFLDSKRGSDGLLSAEDTAVYDKMESDVVALGKEIDRLERQSAMDADLAKPTRNLITESPQNRTTPLPQEGQRPRASAEYHKAFWNAMRGAYTPEMYNALSVGTDTEGGYLVPDEFEQMLVEGLEEENILRGLSNVITTSSGDRKIPVVTAKGSASWVDEGEEIPKDDNSFGQVSIGAYKVATMMKVSEELLNDSAFDLGPYTAREFARRIGAKEEEAFFTGNGVGRPTGILSETGGGQIGVTAAATAISLDDMIDLFHSLHTPYRRNATFIMNDATVKSIRKLKDNTGQYLWQPSIKEGTPDTILNRPVLTSAFVPTVATGAKSVLFGDFSYYWIADRQGRVFRRLVELYAPTGQVGFLMTQRVDGKLVLPEAIKILKHKASGGGEK